MLVCTHNCFCIDTSIGEVVGTSNNCGIICNEKKLKLFRDGVVISNAIIVIKLEMGGVITIKE